MNALLSPPDPGSNTSWVTASHQRRLAPPAFASHSSSRHDPESTVEEGSAGGESAAHTPVKAEDPSGLDFRGGRQAEEDRDHRPTDAEQMEEDSDFRAGGPSVSQAQQFFDKRSVEY